MSPEISTLLSGVCGLLVAIVTQSAFVYAQRIISRSTRETDSQRLLREERLTNELISAMRHEVQVSIERALAAERRAEVAERLLAMVNRSNPSKGEI